MRRIWFVLVVAFVTLLPVPVLGVVTMTDWTTTNQLTIPSAADGITVTPSGTTNTFSSWFEVTSATSTAMILTGAAASPGDGCGADGFDGTIAEFVIGVGTGAAGSETEIAQLEGGCTDDAGINVPHAYALAAVPVDNIASGVRVAVRLKKHGTNTSTWKIALTYYPKPVVGTITATTANSTAYVRAALTPSGTAWNNSAWAQLIASTSSAIAIGPIIAGGKPDPFNGCTFVDTEYDLGTGASGSESVLTTYRTGYSAGSGAATGEIIPLITVPTSTRVAVRMRHQGTSTNSCDFSMAHFSALDATSVTNLTTAQATVWQPSAANPTTISAGGSPWAAGSWVQFIASTANAVAITSVDVTNSNVNATDYEIDLGTGASGSEVVRATIPAVYGGTGLYNGNTNVPMRPAINIPTSTRVAARLKASQVTGSPTVDLALGYVNSPSFKQRSDAIPGTWPSAAVATIAANTTAWANSSWVEVEDSAVERTLLSGIAFRLSGGAQRLESEFDIGVGSAGNETVITKFRAGIRQGNPNGSMYLFLRVPHIIQQGSRVAVRVRQSVTTTQNFIVKTLNTVAEAGFGAIETAFPGFIMRPGAKKAA